MKQPRLEPLATDDEPADQVGALEFPRLARNSDEGVSPAAVLIGRLEQDWSPAMEAAEYRWSPRATLALSFGVSLSLFAAAGWLISRLI